MSTTEAEPAVSKNELLKAATPTLAGTIAATIADPMADHFSEDDNQFLKFHGSYQQDDRDLRKTGKKYIFMVRGRLPGTSEAGRPSSSQNICARVPRQKPRPGTVGEDWSQPPEGVTATTLPCRSITSR